MAERIPDRGLTMGVRASPAAPASSESRFRDCLFDVFENTPTSECPSCYSGWTWATWPGRTTVIKLVSPGGSIPGGAPWGGRLTSRRRPPWQRRPRLDRIGAPLVRPRPGVGTVPMPSPNSRTPSVAHGPIAQDGWTDCPPMSDWQPGSRAARDSRPRLRGGVAVPTVGHVAIMG